MNRLRIAVVGAGQFGRNHVRVVSQSERCELAAVVDVDRNRAEEVAAGAPVFTDFRDIRAEAAIVAVPTSAHVEVACALMEMGVDVLVEKPVAADLEGARRLVETASRMGRILQVGHLERFNPAIRALDGQVTLPLFFEIHRLSVFSPRSLDVDVVLDLMVHDIDIVLSLVGREPEEVRAAGVSILSPKVDIANVRLLFPGGCVANLTASRVSTERVRKLRLFQPREYISLDYGKQHAVRFRVDDQRQISFSELASKKSEPLVLQMESFVECVRNRATPLVDGEAALRALSVALEIADKIEVHGQAVRETLRAAGWPG
jgi:predicted dehydrogenase